MRNKTNKIAVLTVMSLGLAACGDTSAQFYRETGRNVDEGAFGNPTMTNHLINTGQLQAAEDLTRRFQDDVPAMINFSFGSASLDSQARANLTQQANWIRQFPEVRFRVYGHTDLVGSAASNKALGLRRANAAVAFMAELGIDASRLEAIVSFGEEQPLIVTEGRERRNRRTVTEVSGFVQGEGRLLDGKYAQLIYREYTGELNTVAIDGID